MHRAGPGERGGGSYGRRAVVAAKGASMQISVPGKGLSKVHIEKSLTRRNFGTAPIPVESRTAAAFARPSGGLGLLRRPEVRSVRTPNPFFLSSFFLSFFL